MTTWIRHGEMHIVKVLAQLTSLKIHTVTFFSPLGNWGVGTLSCYAQDIFISHARRGLGGRVELRVVRTFIPPTLPWNLKTRWTTDHNIPNEKTHSTLKLDMLKVQDRKFQKQLQTTEDSSCLKRRFQKSIFPNFRNANAEEKTQHAQGRGRWHTTCEQGFIKAHH